MSYQELGNIKLYYEVHGQGTPLVMIRGLGSNTDHLVHPSADFCGIFQNHNV